MLAAGLLLLLLLLALPPDWTADAAEGSGASVWLSFAWLGTQNGTDKRSENVAQAEVANDGGLEEKDSLRPHIWRSCMGAFNVRHPYHCFGR